MKTHPYISFFLITFVLFFSAVSLAAFSEAPSDMPGASYDGYSVPSDNPPSSVLDESTTLQYKMSGLGISSFASGSSVNGTIVIDTNGNVGVNQTTTSSNVRMYVKGSIQSSSLKETSTSVGVANLCTGSSNGSITNGYPLVRC